MAIQLMLLRHVPDDELIEILRLLDEHEVAYYQTSAGAFGISLPALWLGDESRYSEVRALLDDFAAQRLTQARQLRAAQAEHSGSRKMVDIFCESPLKFGFRVAVIALLLCLSVLPFLH